MRTSAILTALAVSGLVIGASAGVLQAGDSASEPGAVPTTTPGMVDLGGISLTPEQSACLVSNAGSLDMNDMNSVMVIMTQCGIQLDDLLAGGTDTGTNNDLTASTLGAPGIVDPAMAQTVIANIGLTPADLTCLDTGLDPMPADDQAALAVMQNCGLSLTGLMIGLVITGAGGQGAPVDPTPTIAGVPTSVAQVSTGNPMVDLLQQELANQGINLTSEQASCLVSSMAAVNTEDMNAMLTLFEQCGISITDLMG